MTRSPWPRKTANLSNSVHHQLTMYALAAGAAGVVRTQLILLLAINRDSTQYKKTPAFR
jgi:hypothetical protein